MLSAPRRKTVTAIRASGVRCEALASANCGSCHTAAIAAAESGDGPVIVRISRGRVLKLPGALKPYLHFSLVRSVCAALRSGSDASG